MLEREPAEHDQALVEADQVAREADRQALPAIDDLPAPLVRQRVERMPGERDRRAVERHGERRERQPQVVGHAGVLREHEARHAVVALVRDGRGVAAACTDDRVRERGDGGREGRQHGGDLSPATSPGTTRDALARGGGRRREPAATRGGRRVGLEAPRQARSLDSPPP